MNEEAPRDGQELELREMQKEKRPGLLRRLLFGSPLRSVFSMLFFFTATIFLLALLSGPPKKRAPGGLGSAKQSEKDLAETNRILSEENTELKERIAKNAPQGAPSNMSRELPFAPPALLVGQGSQAPAVSCPTVPTHGVQGGRGFNSPGEALTQSGAVRQGMGVLNRFKPLTVGAAAAPGLQQSPHTGHPYSSPQGLPPEQRPEQKPEQKKENNLLAGSRALGSIPHGIAAVPGLPYPVTIDLTSMTVGPNNTSTSLKDCSIIAVAGADLSTSRVLLQPKTLNCYRGGEYLSLAVDGYVVDLTDNNSGLHGTVEGRSGKYLWGMIAGSFAGGIGKAFAAGETTSTVSAEGVSTTTVTGDKLKYGLTSGGAASADELARWFKERANKLVDYVQVPPLDAVTVIFTSSVHVPDGGPVVNRKEMSWVK